MKRAIPSFIAFMALFFSLFATGCVAKQKIDGIPDKVVDADGMPIRYLEPISEAVIITNGNDINVCGASIGDAAIDVFEHMIRACAAGAPLFVYLSKDGESVKKLKDANLIIFEGGPLFTLKDGKITEIKLPDNFAMEDAVLEEYPSKPFKEGLRTMMLKLFGGTPELVTDDIVRIRNGNITIEASKDNSYSPILR